MSVELRVTELEVNHENLAKEVHGLHLIVHGKESNQHEVWNDMQDQVRGHITSLHSRFDTLETRFTKMEADVSGLKADVSGLKADMVEVKAGLATVLAWIAKQG